MTQEEIVREIAWKAWKGAANAHRLYPDNKHTFTEYWSGAKELFKEYISHYEKLQSSQQPIPQDINKWIWGKWREYYWCNKFIEADNLTRELQREIEQQKSQIDELKAKLEHYRNETSKVQQFVYDRKDIGLPGQPIFDAIKDFIDKQAAEIESLKKELGKLHSDLLASVRETAYWKQRCEAAEEIVEHVGNVTVLPKGKEKEHLAAIYPLLQKWQTLKQQTHG